MSNANGVEQVVDEWDRDDPESPTAMVLAEPGAIAAINRSEVMVQLDAAHKYARSIVRFMKHSISLATVNVTTAESCMYSVPRGGKSITGPSVRLAEIMASAYGNLHIGARVVDIGDREVTAQGVAWDLETNLRVTVEVQRRIINSNGQRFNDDMIGVTCAAACSIALRNAIFRVVPRAYVDQVYERCRKVAIGDASTLTQRRDEVLSRLAKMGADGARVFNALSVVGVEDITLEHLEVLIGMGTAIKAGDKTVDELFPAPIAAVPGAEQLGRKMSLKKPDPAPPKPAEKQPGPPPVVTTKETITSDGEVSAAGTVVGQVATPAPTVAQKPVDQPKASTPAAADVIDAPKKPAKDDEPLEVAVERWRDMMEFARGHIDKAPAERARREWKERLAKDDERFAEFEDLHARTIRFLKGDKTAMQPRERQPGEDD